MKLSGNLVRSHLRQAANNFTCSSLSYGEGHVDLLPDGETLVFHPCCAAWVNEDALPRTTVDYILSNHTADTVYDYMQDMINESKKLYCEGSLCKNPLRCNASLQVKPMSNTTKWLTLSTYRGCNLNCIMCKIHVADATDKETRLTKMLLDSIKGRDLDVLTPTLMGEPFALDYFVDWCKSLTAKDVREVSVLTNGMLLNKEFITELNDTMKANGVSLRLAFSIDASTKELYEKIRRGGDFDKVIANARHCVDLGILAYVNYVVMPKVNEHELPYLQEAFTKLGLPEPQLLFEHSIIPGAYDLANLKAALEFRIDFNISRQNIRDLLEAQGYL